MNGDYLCVDLKDGKKPYAILVVRPSSAQELCLIRPLYAPETMAEAKEKCIDSFPQCAGISFYLRP